MHYARTLEKAGYRSVYGQVFGEGARPDRNNDVMGYLWQTLEWVSNGTLAPAFSRLLFSGYLHDENLNTIPGGRISMDGHTFDVKIPAYRSIVKDGSFYPGMMSIFAKKRDENAAKYFARQLDILNWSLDEHSKSEVFTVLKRADGSAMASRFKNREEFCRNYLSTLYHENGVAVAVSNIPEMAGMFFVRQMEKFESDKIATGITKADVLTRWVPGLRNRRAGQMVNKSYPSYSAVFKPQ